MTTINIPKASDPELAPSLPEAHYDSSRKVYWVKDGSGQYIEVTESSVRRRLKVQGFSSRVPDAGFISPLDAALLKIQNEYGISYAGPLAGHHAGPLLTRDGKRILVTESLTIIEPKNVDWTILRSFIEGLFDKEQLPFLYGWLKIAYESLRARKWRPGQLLAIAGPADCGKSLLQQLITKIFGGRSAKPYQYMTECTSFNSDLFRAEHLMIDDEASKPSDGGRRSFGSHLKMITANEGHRCHAKGREALMLYPWWRVTATLNSDGENLLVLPELDESIRDKIILLRAHKRSMPMPTETDDQREAFMSQLASGLPGLLDFLIRWKIPAELRSGRFGITHFHHSELQESLEALQPEAQLLELLDVLYFDDSGNPKRRLSAMRIEADLTSVENPFGSQARKLLRGYRACPRLLRDLSEKQPDRVRRVKVRGNKLWDLLPPYLTGAKIQTKANRQK